MEDVLATLSPFSKVLDSPMFQGTGLKDMLTASIPLDRVFVDDFVLTSNTGALTGEMTLVVTGEIHAAVPALDSVELVLFAGAPGFSTLRVEFELGPSHLWLSFIDVAVAFRIGRQLLQPLQPSPSRDLLDGQIEVVLTADLTVSRRGGSWDLDIDLHQGIDLPRAAVASTGIVLTIQRAWAGVRGGAKGFTFDEAIVELPPGIDGLPDLIIRDGFIGTSGVSGSLTAQWVVGFKSESVGQLTIDESTTEIRTHLFSPDFLFAVESVSIALEDNRLTEFAVAGFLQFPADVVNGVMKVQLSLTDDGELLVGISAADGSSLITLRKEDLFKLEINAAEFKRTAEEVALTVRGDLEITNAQIQKYVPKFGLEGFSIYKAAAGGEGTWGFRIEGGTVAINKSINFFDVARLDVKEIGIGERNGTKVFEFSGGVQFDGIDAAGWVYGLRVPIGGTPTLELDGIGLKMLVPSTLELQAEAIHVKEQGIEYFQGKAGLNIIPLGCGALASIKIGKTQDFRFAFLSAQVLFPPPGVPIAGYIPLYLTSVEGLTGINMKPDADSVLGLVPLFEKAPKGLTDSSKWRPERGAVALGFGIGVSAANPVLVNLSALLAFAYPDLLLFIEGKAFILEAPKIGKDPPFHSLIAVDLDDPAALLRIDANYEFVKGVLEAQGACEAYFGPDPGNPNRTTQYFALGKSDRHFPANEPVRAKVLQLYEARSDLYIGPGMWDLGAEIGLPNKTYDLDFASVHFEALVSGRGVVNWGPNQFTGTLGLVGNVGFRIFKKGFDLSLRANVTGKTPDWLVDATLWFGIKFKILFKTFEFGGTIPLHFENRVTPPVPDVLKEIQLKSLINDTSVAPYLSASNSDLPGPSVVPEIEPDTAPVLIFDFPTKDQTKLPFGQDVNNVPDHVSGDHTFHFELTQVQLSRMKIQDWKDGRVDAWEDFAPDLGDAGFSGYLANKNRKPVLYGAWQATQDPEGNSGATELHLLARTPFDYNRPVRLAYRQTGTMMNQNLQLGDGRSVLCNSQEASAALSDAAASIAKAGAGSSAGQSGGSAIPPNSVVRVPSYGLSWKSASDVASLGKPLPYMAAQQVFNQQPHYPYSGVSGWTNQGTPVPVEDPRRCQCCNFLSTSTGFCPPAAVIVLNGDVKDPPVGNAGIMLIGGFADAVVTTGRKQRVGPCEVVSDQDYAEEFRYLEWHDDIAWDPSSRNAVTIVKLKGGELRLLFRDLARKTTIHYETMYPDQDLPSYAEVVAGAFCSETPMLRFNSEQPLNRGGLKLKGAYRKEFSATKFWADGIPVKKHPVVNDRSYGQLVVTARSGGAFNELRLDVSGPLRLYSVCWETDVSDELAQTNTQVEDYIDLIWPGSTVQDGQSGGTSGPANTGSIGLVTPEGGVRPGYLYRLHLNTSQSRTTLPTDGHEREYTALYTVPRPPSDLTPYVVSTFPGDNKFPHYRCYELYVRLGKNYVHNLMGEQNDRITVEVKREGEVISTVPFRDWQYNNLQEFSADKDASRKGWGWGKAGDGHLPTPEEDVWLAAYNRDRPPEDQITSAMALGDDVIWVYPQNPVLFRADFGAVGTAEKPIPGFSAATDENGHVLSNRWRVSGAMLDHSPLGGDSEVNPAQSFLLGEGSINEGYSCLVWVQPREGPSKSDSMFGLVLSAVRDKNAALSSYLAVEFDSGKGTIALKQKRAAGEPVVAKAEKRLALPLESWTKITARVVMIGGKLAVTVSCDEDQIFSLPSDLNQIEGVVGLMAQPGFRGLFDNFEVVSLDRLTSLPSPSATHQLIFKYDNEHELLKAEFKASRYLDLFDQLGSIGRVVMPPQQGILGDEAALRQAASAWVAAKAKLLEAIGNVYLMERKYVLKLTSLDDIEKSRLTLREARLDLDNSFKTISDLLAFELNPRADRPELMLSKSGLGLLLQSDEPIDWTRITAGAVEIQPPTSGSTQVAVVQFDTQIIHNSDFSRAILVLWENQASIKRFEAGTTYVWGLTEYGSLPPNLAWLEGWVAHRRKNHRLTFQVSKSA